MQNLPGHIAVIMDGNGRWAEKRGLSRSQGHLAGMDAVSSLVGECRSLNIPYVTLYAFSKENWNRPQAEVSFLFDLFLRFVRQEMPLMMKRGIRLGFIGDKRDLPLSVRRALELAMAKTSVNADMMLTLAISYSGREDILQAARRALAAGLSPEELDEKRFRSLMYAPELPDPDLIIRTSGECRISNFLLFQGAYAELYFTPLLWPDFDAQALHDALDEYARRERRFGRTSACAGSVEA